MNSKEEKTRRKLFKECLKKLAERYIELESVWEDYRSVMVKEFKKPEKSYSGMEAEKQLLAHWLTYVLDFQIDVKKLWGCDGAFYHMLNVADTYLTNGLEEGIKRLLELVSEKKIWHRFFFSKPHYLFDKIISTLIVLEKFERSIFCYMVWYLQESYKNLKEFVKKYQLIKNRIGNINVFFENNWIRILVHGLYTLTYRWPLTAYESMSEKYKKQIMNKKQNLEDVTKEIIGKYEKMIEDLFLEILRDSLFVELLSVRFCYEWGCDCDLKPKRVWSAVKDYVCYNHWRKTIANRLSELKKRPCELKISLHKINGENPNPEFIEKLWQFFVMEYEEFEEKYMEQIELPGDLRNAKGLREDFGIVCDEINEILKDGPSARVFVRKLFNEFRNNMKQKRYYPIYAEHTYYRKEKQ
ncbi:MAG: hypothetical protein ACTSUJ_05530 [Candidatus Njordarchaeales archaeon]